MQSTNFGATYKLDRNDKHGLIALSGFGSNPGNLTGKLFLPRNIRSDAPLVVVLHGCTQTAEGYAIGAGWLDLAERNGFAVLLPEQQRNNNMNLCFNWFEPGDMQRGAGEPASIKQMIDDAVRSNNIDPDRIFITGLSAGAAMAGVMLATYPEVFAGGGLIAGLPYGVAASMPAAMQRMRRASSDSAGTLGDMVQGASSHDRKWPRISVWHGSADHTVHSSNADATVAQWLNVHGLTDKDVVADKINGFPHWTWHNADGAVCVELFEITGMGHGTPLDSKSQNSSGKAGPYLLDVGISSTAHLASFWKLHEHVGSKPAKTTQFAKPSPLARRPIAARLLHPIKPEEHGVEKMINDALRAAGLMR